MAKIWITGCAGLLGSHLCDALLTAGHEVSGNDTLIGGEHDNVPRGVDFHIFDCNERDKLCVALSGFEYLVHTAALAYEGLSVFSPHLIATNIVGGSVAVFSAAVTAGVKRIVFCSSMARYGAARPPFTEDQVCAPNDPYGISKISAEHFLLNLCETHGVEFVIAVPHNIIGPRQRYCDPYRNVASIMVNLALQGRQPFIYGDGSQLRCFSFVGDCIPCLLKMIFEPGLAGEVINIGPDEMPCTIFELARLIWQLCQGEKARFEPVYLPARPQEVKIALCSSDKARKLLNYQTKTHLYDGLTSIVEYVRQKGPRPFEYHLPVEIVTSETPKTWTDRLL